MHIIFVTFKGSNKDKEIFLRLINENINVVSSFLSLGVVEANSGDQLPPPNDSSTV